MLQNKIFFYATTALVTIAAVGSGAANLSAAAPIQKSMQSLGIPFYFMTMLGTFKILGAIGIWQNKVNFLREWAYAGFTFLFIGATAVHVLHGDPIGKALPPAMILVFTLLSYASFRARAAS